MTATFALSASACLFHADCREALKALPNNSLDSCVTDPPYALVSVVKRFGSPTAAPAKGNDAYMRASAGFMGKTWDTGEVAFAPEFWAEVLRVLKPGAFVVAFGASRGYHRMACAIEDAGFEIRDSLMWLYGTGFPKSHDVSKGIDRALGTESVVVSERVTGWQGTLGGKAALGGIGDAPDVRREYAPATPAAREWEGWGTALKPAFEPIVLARKPLSEGTVAANVLRWRTGALNIDACRIAATDKTPFPVGATSADGSIKTGLHSKPRGDDTNKDGRWPANVVHDGSDEVMAGFPNDGKKARQPRVVVKGNGSGADAAGNTSAAYGAESRKVGSVVGVDRGDSGSAARFFYSAKASKVDRAGSKHPTVKPVSLMEWLCQLITPPGGTVLDPFAGSGTTGIAAQNKGFNCVLVEREAEYIDDIRRRFGPLPTVKSPPLAAD